MKKEPDSLYQSHYFRANKLATEMALLLARMNDYMTIVKTVRTPKGWKCKKKGCTTKFKHIHSTFNCLKK